MHCCWYSSAACQIVPSPSVPSAHCLRDSASVTSHNNIPRLRPTPPTLTHPHPYPSPSPILRFNCSAFVVCRAFSQSANQRSASIDRRFNRRHKYKTALEKAQLYRLIDDDDIGLRRTPPPFQAFKVRRSGVDFFLGGGVKWGWQRENLNAF